MKVAATLEQGNTNQHVPAKGLQEASEITFEVGKLIYLYPRPGFENAASPIAPLLQLTEVLATEG